MASTNRLYVAGVTRPGTDLSLDEERSSYVARVLRLRSGDALVLFDGKGREYDATITRVSRKTVVVLVGEARERACESPLAIDLVQGVSRGDRMDTVVQKATELGVRRITPVLTERSVVQLDADRAARRTRHWCKVAESACEQCGRNTVPGIDAPQPFDTWIRLPATGEALQILLHPVADANLMSLQPAHQTLQLLIGPEGGLSESERERALAAGFGACSLGPRILRTETAAIAAIAVLQARWGDLA